MAMPRNFPSTGPEAYGMTRKQKQLLDVITSYYLSHGVSPSFDEMMVEMDLRSKSNVHSLVHALAERGKIRLLPNRARSIEPVFDQVLELRLPVELEAVLRERAIVHGETLQAAAIRALRENFFPKTGGAQIDRP